MDLTLFLFDSTKKLRGVITQGIAKLIHKERARTLNAEIKTMHGAKPGECLGFRCVDGRFRLFCIEYADEYDNTATTGITATDAAADELTGTILSVTEQESADVGTAAKELLESIGWTLGVNEAGGKKAPIEGGLKSAWDVLQGFESDGNLYIEPYYLFDGNRITGKAVDILAKRPVYRGRFVQRGTDAENIIITRKKRPRPMIFGEGADGLTLADVEWSTANGDPADKPLGQLWIGVPRAVARYPGQGQVYRVDTTDANELMVKCWEKAQEETEPGMTATATISDMEMAAGQTWKSVRRWDLVRVRPRYGVDVEEQVIEIERNYVRTDQTKITLGEEAESTARQVKSLTKTSAVNTQELTKTKTQLKDMLITVQELDEYTRVTITEAWVDLKAGTESSFAQIGARFEDMDAENQERYRIVSEAILTLESDIDSATAELAARIGKTEGEYEELSEAVLQLDAETDSALANLGVRVSRNEQDISTAALTLYGDETTAQAGLVARVGDNEASLLLQADEIGTLFAIKADTTYVQRLVAEEIEAAVGNIELSIAEAIITGSVTANSGVIGALTLGGDPIRKTTISVVTGISGGMAQTADVEFLNTEVGSVSTVELGSATRLGAMYTQGAEYDGPLYEPGVSGRRQGNPVPVKLYTAFGSEGYLRGTSVRVTPIGRAVSSVYPTLYAYEGSGIYTAVYTGNMYYSGTAQTYYRGDGALGIGVESEFEANTLYYPGDIVTLQGNPITNVQLYREGTYYSGGLYTDFEPASVTIQSLKALTA